MESEEDGILFVARETNGIIRGELIWFIWVIVCFVRPIGCISLKSF